MLSPGILRTARLRALFCALLLLVCVVAPARAVAGDTSAGYQVLNTRYWSIFYPHGEEKAAAWYASFADDTDEIVSEMLGSDPVQGLKLHIYATEQEYTQANPMAETHQGIMAHAIPEQKEVGVAVERLRQVPPELARESFRHEMTHIVAGVLSNNNLPVGFQEGLAQYNELSASRGQSVAEAIKSAQGQGVSLLSWRALNDRSTFARNIDVAYPQSYTVMAFLAEKYGMASYGHFLHNLAEGSGLDDSINWAFGQSVDNLETQWKAYLPDFLKEGWKVDLFTYYDLTPAQTLYDSGRYKEAEDYYAQAERLYRDLGKTAKADDIAALKKKAIDAQGATDLTGDARKALEAHDYVTANDIARKAGATYGTLGLSSTHTKADETARLAQQGLAAMDLLNKAQKHLAGWDFVSADAEARQAAETFVALGDDARVADANRILSSMWVWRRVGGLAALALAVLALGLGAWAYLRTRNRRRNLQGRLQVEENASWL